MRREEERRRIISLLREYFAPRERFRIVILFGSVARGDIKRESDVDLAFLAEPPLSEKEYSKLYGDLEDLLHRPLSLVNLARISRSPSFAFNILSEGIPLLIRDQEQWRTMRERILKIYWDTEYLRDLNWRYFKERLRRLCARTSHQAFK